jgi:hypothetical protein
VVSTDYASIDVVFYNTEFERCFVITVELNVQAVETEKSRKYNSVE